MNGAETPARPVWRGRGLWLRLCLVALLLIASMATASLRNDSFEFCTTRAYGYPCPWYVDWCECERNASRFPWDYWAINLALAIGLSEALLRLLRWIVSPPRRRLYRT